MKLVRATFVAAAIVAAGIAASSPALALCKYGGPHCVNPNPNFDFKMPETIYIPEDSWGGFEDCVYYPGSNCQY